MAESTQEPSRAEIEAAYEAYQAAIHSTKLWDPPISAALKAAAEVRAQERDGSHA